MPEQDLRQLIRGLSPGALAIFKRQLSALPERERQRAFARLTDVPELSDIIGKATPIREITEKKPTTTMRTEEVPLWQRGLQTVSAPLNWISRNITEPFGTVVTAPFTPATAGTEGMNWYERERAEYGAWNDPNWGFLGVKGVLETLPWLAVPSAGGILGRAAGIGVKGAGLLGLAQKGGQVGRAAKVAAKVVKPIAAVEAVPGKIVGKAVEKVLPKKAVPVAPKVGKPVVGIAGEKVGEGIISPIKVAEASIPPVKPPPPIAVGAEAIPEPSGLNQIWEKATGKGAAEREQAIQKSIAKNTAERFSKFEARVRELAPEEVSESKIAQIIKEELSGPKYERTPIGITQEIVDEGIEKIRQILTTEGEVHFGSEFTATVKAWTNWCETGHLPKTVGTAGKSAYTRFKRVFGNELADMSPTELKKLAGKSLPEGIGFPPSKLRLPEEQLPAMVMADYLKAQPLDKAGEQLMMFPKPMRDKVWEAIKAKGERVPDYLNILRATLSSGDVSGWWRQGAIAFARHPIAGLKNAKASLKAMFDPKYTADIDRMITTDPDIVDFIARSNRGGGEFYLAPPIEKITGLGIKEEPYMSNVATRIPVLGAIIRASGRNFITFLNLMRYHMVKDFTKGWVEPLKRTGQALTDMDYAQMSRLINTGTGRGDLKLLGMDFNKQGALLNTLLFSPRLFFSRFQWPAMIGSPSKAVRVEAWKQIGSFLAAGGSAISALKLMGGGDFELDPRSADFGKLQMGDTRLDFWTGYAQYMRMLAQLATAQRKTEGGFIQQVSRGDVIWRFLQSKESPAVGILNDLWQGQTFIGEEFPAKTPAGLLEQAIQRAAPMAIQDMVDGFIQSGAVGGMIAAIGLYGVGVVTYMDEVKRVRDKVAQQKYGMTWDEVGQQYGQTAQLQLEQTTPSLIEAEKKQEEKYATGAPTVMGQWRKEGQSIEDTYRDAINKAAAEFRETNNGVVFRDKVDLVSHYRRQAYEARGKRKEYQDITAYYNEPLKPEQKAKMNPGDVLRREYYQQMFAPDMYDEYDNYLFEEAEKKEQMFLARHGQQALDYIEEYQGSRWRDKPVELKALEEARELLRPYREIADRVWSMYPKGLQELSEQIQTMERTDPDRAKQTLRKYPMILRARELIARYRKQMRQYNPVIAQAYRMFYG